MTEINFFKIAGMFIIPFLVVLIPLFLGQRYGIYVSKKSVHLEEAPVGSVVGAAFGLLAFMLAFTFQIAADRYNSRKELLLEEVTDIRTAWLRAGLLQEPYRSTSKELLLEYVDLRIPPPKNQVALDRLLSGSQRILDKLWVQCEGLAELDRSSEVYSLFTGSVNDLFNDYNKRVTMTLEYRLPPIVLWILFIISSCSMFILGYQFGISGKGSFGLNLLLAFIFGIVMLLILALENPESGLATLNQKPILTLQKQLQERTIR